MSEARARLFDPETSWDAAASVKDLTEKQEGVLQIFELYGTLTDEELIEVYAHHTKMGRVPPQSESGIRTRRSELARAEELEEAGYGTTRAGRKCRRWRRR